VKLSKAVKTKIASSNIRETASQLARNTWMFRQDIPSTLLPWIDHFHVKSEVQIPYAVNQIPFWFHIVDQRIKEAQSIASKLPHLQPEECSLPAKMLLVEDKEEFDPIQWNSQQLPLAYIKGVLERHTLLSADEKWNVYILLLIHGFLLTFLSMWQCRFRVVHTVNSSKLVTASVVTRGSGSDCNICKRSLYSHGCDVCHWILTSKENVCVKCMPHTKVMCVHFSLINDFCITQLVFPHGQTHLIPEHLVNQFAKEEDSLGKPLGLQAHELLWATFLSATYRSGSSCSTGKLGVIANLVISFLVA
jgi:hypothetical protein